MGSKCTKCFCGFSEPPSPCSLCLHNLWALFYVTQCGAQRAPHLREKSQHGGKPNGKIRKIPCISPWFIPRSTHIAEAPLNSLRLRALEMLYFWEIYVRCTPFISCMSGITPLHSVCQVHLPFILCMSGVPPSTLYVRCTPIASV